MVFKVTTEPTVEPYTLTEVKTLMSIPDTQSDDPITSYITSARRQAELYLQQKIITQTLEMVLDDFPSDGIELEQGPVQSITSVIYTDADGTDQTIASSNYSLDNYGKRVWLLPAYDYSWPSVRPIANAVKIKYICGFGNSGAEVPEDIRQAMLLVIGHWLRFQKEAESGIGPTRIPRQFYDLLSPHRLVVM